MRTLDITQKTDNLLKINKERILEFPYQYHKLHNGISIVFKRNRSIVTHSGVFIRVGSRDEAKDEEGIAHFIEHALFKGTEHRKPYHIFNRIDGVGGELNAYTTKEETCVYASALSEHLERCLELFSDVLFHSAFPEKELTKEKDVIIDEINSYKDSPTELIFDEFEEKIFGSHPLAHNILGTPKNVKHFSSDKVRDFMQRNYTTDKMVISVVGNEEFSRVIRLCKKYFEVHPATTSSSSRTPVTEYVTFHNSRNKHIHQVHALLGCKAYNIFNQKKVAFTLLNNVLGGPAMNSRLNVAIREKYGLCYSIESQYNPFSDSGLFYVYAAMDAEFKDRIVELIMQELRRVKEVRITAMQLHNAQQQLIGQIAISNELPLNEMQAMGKSYLIYEKVDSLEEMNSYINEVDAALLQEVANEIFDEKQFSWLLYL